MGFGNPILAGNTLARTAVQSEDFVAGVSGWAIFRDGSAEFNNVTVRGTVDVTGSLGNRVFIHTDSGIVPGETTATIDLYPGSYADNAVPVSSHGNITVTAIDGPPHYSQLLISSPGHNYSSNIFMTGDTIEGGGVNDTTITIGSKQIDIGYSLPSGTTVTTLTGSTIIDGTLTTARPHLIVPFGQTLTTGTATILTPGAPILNVGGMLNAGIITIPATGFYEIGVALRYASQAVAAGIRLANVMVNGADYMQFNEGTSGFNATNIEAGGSIRDTFNIGDVIAFRGFHTAGANLAIIGKSQGWVESIIG